ncbi:MAG: PD-(D/E)XK nuclease family protein [Lentisphaeria bacterium]
MARKLVNELTWSVSRDKLFRTCERAYYYNYYGSWGGWDRNADPHTRKLYILKQIKSMPMWAGQIVHEVIAEALRGYSMKKSPITTGELQARARQKLRNGWVDAVDRAWLQKPKKNNLHELYYGNGKTLPPEQTERIKKRVYQCLQAFAGSTVLKEMLAASYMSWRPVDTLDSFMLDDQLKVWCALDFAFVTPAGSLRVIDWKTGKERANDLRLQLACYAQYAQLEWMTPIEQQQLQAVFLPENARVSEYKISAEDLVSAKDTILNSAAEMRRKLVKPEANEAREEDFTCCNDAATCRQCKFREVCQPENTF